MARPVTFSPFEYLRDDDRRQIHVVARRTLDVVDFAEILRRQVDEGTWAYGVLYDLRRQNAVIPLEDSDRLRAGVFHGVRALGPRGPVALVAWDAGVLAWLQGYEALARDAGLHVRVCTRVADGRAYLETHQLQTA